MLACKKGSFEAFIKLNAGLLEEPIWGIYQIKCWLDILAVWSPLDGG